MSTSYSSSNAIDATMPNNKFELGNKRTLTINTNNGQYNREYDGLFPPTNVNPMTMAAAALAMFGVAATNSTNGPNVMLSANELNNSSYVNPFFYQTFLRFPLHQKPPQTGNATTSVSSQSPSSTAPNAYNFFSI